VQAVQNSTFKAIILKIPSCLDASSSTAFNIIHHSLCGSRNYPYYPHGRSLEIPRGRGDLKAKLLEGQYEAKLEFPGGCGGAKQKTFHGGGSMDIPWNYTFTDSIPANL